MKKIIFRMVVATSVYFIVGFVLLAIREFLVNNIQKEILMIGIVLTAMLLGWSVAKKIFAELIDKQSIFYIAAKHNLSICSAIVMIAIIDPSGDFSKIGLEFFVILAGFTVFILLTFTFSYWIINRIFGERPNLPF